MRLRLKIYKVFLVLSMLLTILLTACDIGAIFNEVEEEHKVPPLLEKSGNDKKPTPPKTEVNLDIKIGQMLMVGFRGVSVSDKSPIVRDIKKFHLGGVILFDYDFLPKKWGRNIKSPQQVKKLVEGLQAVSPIPLFIAIDQEGGKINRLKNKNFRLRTVSAQYLGQQNDLELTYTKASEIAKTLAQLGINFNFAPVVDLNINPSNPVIGRFRRSFSADPSIVTQHALQFIKAHHEQEIITVLKHFPGHGSSSQDSHRGWVDVTNTWKPVELKPYINLIDKTDVIMTAHVFNRSLDPEYPATLSKRIITNILRQDLHYDGVVVSDDLQMKAITSNYGFKEAIQATIEAGVDIILIGNNLKYDPNIAERTVNVINQLIAEGNITEERIDKSYQRIQQLKRRWLNEQQIRDEDVTMPVKLGKEAESFEESCAGHRLTINALPPDSTIKIMNIKPKYQPGICLKRGIYHISVTHPGYQSQKLSIRITDFDVIEPVILGR